MAKKSKKPKSNSKRVKKAVTKKSPASVRSKAAHRTAEGKFSKAVFTQIGGKECPRFAAMTWAERDAFMKKPENVAVRERYENHMDSIESGTKA